MIILNEADVRKQLTMPLCISLMKQALVKLETGEAVQPLRNVITLPGHNLFGFMPAWMDDYFGAKIITGFNGNAGTEYPSHMGYIMIFDSVHGAPVGMADAGAVTELRTGSGLRCGNGFVGAKGCQIACGDRLRRAGALPSGGDPLRPQY